MAPLSYLAVLLLGVFTRFTLSNCQTFSWGGCPYPPVKSDFDVERYYGKWYELARFEGTTYEDSLKCISATYSSGESADEVVVFNQGLDIETGEVDSIRGTATIPDPSVPAKLAVSFFWYLPPGNYWVLDTDYENYAYVHSCWGLWNWFNFQGNWILQRNNNFNNATYIAALTYFENAGVNSSRFEISDQVGCSE